MKRYTAYSLVALLLLQCGCHDDSERNIETTNGSTFHFTAVPSTQPSNESAIVGEWLCQDYFPEQGDVEFTLTFFADHRAFGEYRNRQYRHTIVATWYRNEVGLFLEGKYKNSGYPPLEFDFMKPIGFISADTITFDGRTFKRKS